MPNGIEFLSDLELEKYLKDMNDRELSEFTARQVYDVCNLSYSNERRIISLEKRDNKIIGLVATIGTFVGACIVGVIDYTIRKGG